MFHAPYSHLPIFNKSSFLCSITHSLLLTKTNLYTPEYFLLFSFSCVALEVIAEFLAFKYCIFNSYADRIDHFQMMIEGHEVGNLLNTTSFSSLRPRHFDLSCKSHKP